MFAVCAYWGETEMKFVGMYKTTDDAYKTAENEYNRLKN
jgi:hypothetical protein